MMPVPLTTSLPWFGVAAVVYAIVTRLRRLLRPPYVAFELASDPKHALNILIEWRRNDLVSRAAVTVIVDAVFVPCYVLATEALLYSIHDVNGPSAIVVTNVAFMSGMFLTAIANWVEDAALLVALGRGKPWMVTGARVCAKFKYVMIALTLLYLIFRGEVYLYERLRAIVQPGHWKTMGWVVGATLLLAFLVARRLSAFSQRHPTLLSLQLAPDRLTAKGILEQWGRRGRRDAEISLALQSGLALLVGVILATACRTTDIGARFVQKGGGAVAWLALIAAACHLAQNFGAFIAVHRGEMGWWVDMMRRIGKVRITLAAFVGVYFVALIVAVEYSLLSMAGRWISDHAPKIPLPWS